MELESTHHSTVWDHADTMAIRNVVVDQADQASGQATFCSDAQVSPQSPISSSGTLGLCCCALRLDPYLALIESTITSYGPPK